MEKKLYFISTNAGNEVVSDDGEIRRIHYKTVPDVLDARDATEYLKSIEDDSSWERYDEPFEDLYDFGSDAKIIAEISTNI